VFSYSSPAPSSGSAGAWEVAAADADAALARLDLSGTVDGVLLLAGCLRNVLKEAYLIHLPFAKLHLPFIALAIGSGSPGISAASIRG